MRRGLVRGVVRQGNVRWGWSRLSELELLRPLLALQSYHLTRLGCLSVGTYLELGPFWWL